MPNITKSDKNAVYTYCSIEFPFCI